MHEKEKEIDILQLCFYLLDHLGIIVLFTVIGMVLIGGYAYYKESKNIGEIKKSTIQDIINQNHEKSYPSENSKAASLSTADVDPPTGAYVIRSRMFLDFNLEEIKGKEYLDYSDMLSAVQGDAIEILLSDGVLSDTIEELHLRDYEDMNELTVNQLKWMLRSNISGEGTISFTVVDVDKDRAIAINNAIIDEFMEKVAIMPSVDSAEVLDAPSVVGYGGDYTVSKLNKKRILKYALMGGFLGIIISTGIYMMFFVFIDAVRTRDDIEFLGANCFGIIPERQDKKENEIKRIAYNISLLDGVRVLMFVPVDDYSKLSEMSTKISEELGDIDVKAKLILGNEKKVKDIYKDINSCDDYDKVIVVAKDIKNYSDAYLIGTYCDIAIMYGTYGKTHSSDLEFAIKEIGKTGIDISGVIIEEARHV